MTELRATEEKWAASVARERAEFDDANVREMERHMDGEMDDAASDDSVDGAVGTAGDATDIAEESIVDDAPRRALPMRTKRGVRRGAQGLFERRHAERLCREEIVERAKHLPDLPRAILTAHYDLGMTINDLATIHSLAPYALRRRIWRWRSAICDPCFPLVVTFGEQLPPALRELARGHWLAGETLRQLAAKHGVTLHQIRRQLALARSLLLIEMRGRLEFPSERARRILEGKK